MWIFVSLSHTLMCVQCNPPTIDVLWARAQQDGLSLLPSVAFTGPDHSLDTLRVQPALLLPFTTGRCHQDPSSVLFSRKQMPVSVFTCPLRLHGTYLKFPQGHPYFPLHRCTRVSLRISTTSCARLTWYRHPDLYEQFLLEPFTLVWGYPFIPHGRERRAKYFTFNLWTPMLTQSVGVSLNTLSASTATWVLEVGIEGPVFSPLVISHVL